MVKRTRNPYTRSIDREGDVIAASASTSWLHRVRLPRPGSSARGADRRAPEAVAHLSLTGERDAFTRSSGLIPERVGGSASICVGAVIETRDAFERTVRRFVPAGSQAHLIRQQGVDFASHRVVVLGFRVPSLSWVRLAGVYDLDDHIEACADADDPPSRTGASGVGLIWFALARGDKPVRVRPFDRFRSQATRRAVNVSG